MKLRKQSAVNILLVELMGVIIFLSIALVILVYLYTGIYKLTIRTKELVVGSRVVQNLAEYSKDTNSREEYEMLLEKLGDKVVTPEGVEWEIYYSETGEIDELQDFKYLVSIVIESEELKNGEWVTIRLTAKSNRGRDVTEELSVNKYYTKRG